MGTSTGDVHEGHTFTARDGSMTGGYVDDRSPDHQHGNIGKLWNDEIHTDGHLSIVDADAGESYAQTGTYYGTHGRVILQTNGDWTYYASIGQDATGRAIDHLGKGESLTDTVTVKSADGTTHDIVVTIHGDNDRPYCSSEVQLNSGKEDLAQTITSAELLANTIDVDTNDLGKLTITNLHADHGSILDNQDGTFTFTPTKDYNGQVHFTYDVQDAHGGVTHTGATTSLSAVGDAAVITGSGSGVKEDINVDISSGHLLGASGVFHVVDPDGPAQSQFPDVLYGGIYQGSHGGDLQVNSNGNYYYHISNYLVQHLSEGQILKEEYTIHSVDGTLHKVEFTVEGTNDKPVLSAQSQSVTEGGTLLSGQMHATDVDTKDTHTFTIDKPVDGLTFNNDGSYTFDPSHASYQNLGANNDQVIHVQVKVDDHNGGTDTKTLTLVVHGTNDGATIGGQDTFIVQEDHNLTLNSGNTIIYNGQLTITDADAGEDHFDGNLHQNQQTGTWDTGYTTQEGGKLILQSNGSYRYEIDNSLAKIQSLGSSETLIDTVTVRSADGTPHQIQVTIQGDNDAPVASSAVTLAAGTEDTDVVLHASDLLANATDIDHDDAGKLSVANLIADHGTITDNHNGTFTFHPTQDYNGKVSFTYDVQDAHGGSVAASASITLAPTRDSAVITGADTGTIIEDHNVGPSSNHPVAASGLLNVSDPDAGQDHFQVNRFGEQVINDPFGGFLRITPNGAWGYEVANSRLQSLAEGEVEKVVYRVYSADHTAHDITITVTGTNDRPTITATTLAHGTEDTHYQMQASQFGFTDIDTGDTLHSIAITDLPPATQGKFLLDGHAITAGQQILTADISKLQFVPAQDFNGDVQFKYTVNDGHTDSTEATNTLHFDAVGDAAVITGTTTGDVDEGHGTYRDRSPNYAQPGMGKLTNDPLYTDGKLEIIDPDAGEGQFDTKGGGYSYHGTYGQLILNADGNWHYKVTVGSNQQNVATQIDQLGDGQQLTDTITVYSKDGTAQDIVITIHGDNDRPYISSEVTLATGTEDTALTFTKADLLANTVDVDANDAGKLSIANLLVDHGSVVDNKDGTYTFTPTKDYNGQVHFSYDVTDAHGGTTHTGANTTLSAVNDAATIAGVDTGSVTEDSFTGMQWLITKGQLTISDADTGEDKFDPMVHAQNNAGIGYDTKLGGHVLLSKDGSWQYNMDNFSPAVQKLAEGETAIDTVTIHSVDGTPHEIKITIHGTNDAPVLSVTQTTPTTGTLTETDVDVNDTHTFSVVSSTGQFGSLSVDPDSGAYVYTANGSVAGMSYNSATNTYHGADVFEVKVADNHGGESSKYITFDANGHVSVVPGQSPTILTSVPSNPLVMTTQPNLPAGTNTPPNNAVTVDLAASSDTGTSDTDNLTKDNTPTITGHTDIPYSQVTIYDGSTPIGHAVSDRSGQYNVAVSSLSNGDHNLSAKALAPSSALPATSSLLAVHVDTVVAPLTIGLTHDTGGNTSDLITSDGALTIGGQEAGATVEYSTDNGHTWTSSFTPLQGSNTVSVRQTDTAGNVSASASLTFTLDDKIAAPSIDMKASTDSGVSTTDDLTNIHTPIITGSAEANSAISITDETGKVIATGIANSSGIYQLTTSNITEGQHTLTVSSTDAAGNHNSASLPIEVDYTAPTISNVSLSTETTHQPTFSGTVALDTVSVDIVIKDGSTIIETLHATLDGQGGYTVDATNLPDSSYTAYIQATDKAGNTTASGYTGTFDRFSVDTHASSPTISFESTGADNIYNAAEVASGAANTITSTIHLPSDAQPKDTLTINGQPHIITHAEYVAKSVNVEVAPGASITASISDQNGNTSTVTNATAPSADTTVTPLQVSLTHDTGSGTSDLITNDGTLTITGQEAGATVEYSTDNGQTWTSSFTPQQGSNTVSVRQTDTAGNVSTSSSLSFTLDNTATAPSVSLTSDSGSSSSDKITNVGDLSVGGIEQGATVEYSIDNGVHWSTQFTPTEGQNNVQVRQTDVAGNVSPSTSLSYTLDTQTDIRVNSVTIDQNGPGMFVQVYLPNDSDVTQIEITSDGGGTPLIVDLQTVKRPAPSSSARHPDHQYLEFTNIDLSSLPDGHLTVHVTGQDLAGNTLDTQSTGATGHPLIWDTVASASDDSNTAIEDSTIPVSGNLLSNDADAATVTTTGDIQGTYGVFHLSADGSYTYTLNNQLSVIQQLDSTSSPLVDSIAYTASDNHGNQATAHLAISIQGTDDNHAPVVTAHPVSTDEDATHTFTTTEFGYTDQDGDALQFVTISSIPSHGLLLLNGKAVTANQQITKADLDAGHLTFTPISNENGANYAQFTFTANDGHQDSASATMIVDVNAVNDAPIVGSSFISSLEDKPHAFTTADFKYSDIDGDALNHITITNVAHGVLSLNGATVNVGDDVSASDVSSLIFTPTHNYFSSGVSGLGAVQFTANDGQADSKEGSIFINIADVADPATFTGDSIGVAKEDTTLQASGTLTSSDPDGTIGFTAVQGGVGIVGSKGYGHAHIDSNGNWTYDLYNKHPIVQQLSEGQTDTETITVQSADGTHHDIVVTITGTNDAPILGVNQTSSTTGTLTGTDVDVKDTHTFSVVSSTGQFGSLSVDPNTGDYVYTPNTSITGMSYNSATNTYHGVDVFEVKVNDGHTEDSKFITFDASGHVTTSPTGGLVISTTVHQQPAVTATQPTLSSGTNVAPTNTVTLDLASTSDSGSSSTDNLTNDTTPTITGHTDIPFSKVTIYDGSTPVGHSVSDASGQYSVSVSSLSDGDHNLSAKALAPSSVMSATSSPLSVHIDTQVHVGIQTDPITADNVINAQESNSSIDITGSVSGDFNTGDIVTLDVNGTQHTGVVDAKGHYSIAVPGSELIADADQKIEASVAVTDTAGNSAHATADVTYQVDTQVSVPTITFENAGSDNLYSKAEIARGHANTITATVTPPGDAKIGEHLVVNGQDHVLDAHTLQHGIQIEVHPGSNVQATMTDEHGNTAGSQGFAASAIPEPIIVRPPSGSHQVSGTLGVPPLLPSLTPVPTAQSGWRIHLPNGQYVTSHHGQYGTLTIDPQTGHLHYQEQAQVHTGPHGSASGIGQHEDKFEVALQGTNQDEVVAHVNIQILSHGPGHSGKLTVGTEVVDMTITPLVHTSHPAPPPPPPVQHDEPDMASQADFTVTLSDDSNLDLTQQTHQEPDQKTSHHGAAAYLDALGIKPDATSTTVHDQPADMDIILAQVDQPDVATHDQAHLDMSDALEHHDANINHNQDDEHHHHNDVDGLPDIDPNS
ncbi:Putative RTX toxin, VCBS repeat protein [Vibrio coralliirubri]|nr:Putative RTX toxin, VCBS repeat protein [Vibrio coralliirubri]